MNVYSDPDLLKRVTGDTFTHMWRNGKPYDRRGNCLEDDAGITRRATFSGPGRPTKAEKKKAKKARTAAKLLDRAIAESFLRKDVYPPP